MGRDRGQRSASDLILRNVEDKVVGKTMNQTSINLIAIAVFGLTASALLGPLLQISPVIPAIVVIGLLGTATVDAWAFQGQGGTVLMDWLSTSQAETRERVLHHEAGHFLLAQVLEIPVNDYSLSAWEALRKQLPGQGGVIFDTTQLEQQAATGQLSAQWLNRYSMVWMAGVAAEQWLYGDAQGGMDDRRQFQALWQTLGKSSTETRARERWATLQAQTLLEQHELAYRNLVDLMRDRASVAACQAAIAPILAAAEAAALDEAT